MQLLPNSILYYNFPSVNHSNLGAVNPNYVPQLQAKQLNQVNSHNSFNNVINIPNKNEILNAILKFASKKKKNENKDKKNEEEMKNIIKERNRIAANEWRKRRNEYLNQLEIENSELKKQLYSMYHEMKKLQCENNFYDEEIQFFQNFIASNISTRK